MCMHGYHVQLFLTSWALAPAFFQQEYWNGLPFPSPRESCWSRDRTRVSCVSCTGKRILYHWNTWEARFQRSPESTLHQCHTTSLTQATMISRLYFPRHLLMVSDPTLPLSTVCSLPSNHSKPVSSHLKAVQELPSQNQTQVLTRV